MIWVCLPMGYTPHTAVLIWKMSISEWIWVYPIYERFHKDEDNIVNNAGIFFLAASKSLDVHGKVICIWKQSLWAVAVTMRPKSFRASRGHSYILYV